MAGQAQFHKDLAVMNRAYAVFNIAAGDATGKTLFTLPKGAMIAPGSYVQVETAVAGGTTTTVIGTSGDTDALFASADIGPTAAGTKQIVLATLNAGALNVPLAADTDIILTIGASNTAGKIHVNVLFTHSNDPTTI